jgi:hypothetical protein
LAGPGDQCRQTSRYFSGRRNIGIHTGKASGGLVDADLDITEATRADILLPHTPMRHGRASNPESHRWYPVSGEVGYHKWPFVLAGSEPAEADAGVEPKSTTVLELRGDRRQTIVSPSRHDESREEYIWHEYGDPAPTDAPVLERVCAHVAAALLALGAQVRVWRADHVHGDGWPQRKITLTWTGWTGQADEREGEHQRGHLDQAQRRRPLRETGDGHRRRSRAPSPLVSWKERG